MIRLITEWSTNDPGLAEMLRSINAEPDPIIRLELEAMLHSYQARLCYVEIDQLRRLRARRPAHR